MGISCHTNQGIDMKRCIVGIRRHVESQRDRCSKDVPTVWFPSMTTMAAVLSEDNQSLLRLIREKQPKSLTELVELTGR